MHPACRRMYCDAVNVIALTRFVCWNVHFGFCNSDLIGCRTLYILPPALNLLPILLPDHNLVSSFTGPIINPNAKPFETSRNLSHLEQGRSYRITSSGPDSTHRVMITLLDGSCPRPYSSCYAPVHVNVKPTGMAIKADNGSAINRRMTSKQTEALGREIHSELRRSVRLEICRGPRDTSNKPYQLKTLLSC
jgi:hypothetical protein